MSSIEVLVVLGGFLFLGVMIYRLASRKRQASSESVMTIPGVAPGKIIKRHRPTYGVEKGARVAYRSGSRLRYGVCLGYDDSGRMFIHLDEHPDGVRVRRQPHLVRPV